MSDIVHRLRAAARTAPEWLTLEADAADEIERLRGRLPDPDFIADLRDFLDGQADAEYFTDSPSPVPNEAMRLLARLDELYPEE